MNRRTIPVIGMADYGKEHLRKEGITSLPFVESFTRDPKRLRPHYHEFFQVSLLLGSGHLMHDFRETEFAGATMFFLSPGQVHTVRPDKGLKGTIVSFTREFFELQHEAPQGFLFELPFFYAADSPPWLSLTPEETIAAKRMFQEIQQEVDEAQSGAAGVLRSLLHVLFIRASRWHAKTQKGQHGTRAAVLVRGFQQALETHYREWTTIAAYARHLGVSENHLNDVMREETGRAAGEHIRLRRLLDAKRLLLYSDLSVAEVGYQLGFQDPSYFSRFFRRYEAVTPAEFRHQIREKYQKDSA